MTKSAIGPLVGRIYGQYGQRLLDEGVVCTSETGLVFLLRSEVGPLGFELECFKDTAGWKVLRMSVSPMYLTPGKTYETYDLCKINLAQYELLNQLQYKLEWAMLFLSNEEGSKYPIFSRVEVLEPSYSFEEQDFSRIMSVIQMIELDVISVVPVLAAISAGIEISPENALLAARDVPSSLQ